MARETRSQAGCGPRQREIGSEAEQGGNLADEGAAVGSESRNRPADFLGDASAAVLRRQRTASAAHQLAARFVAPQILGVRNAREQRWRGDRIGGIGHAAEVIAA